MIYSEHLYMRKCKSKVKEQNYKVNYYVNERKEYYYENSFEEELRAKVQSVIINANTYIDESTLSYRIDRNNVDINTESAYLAQNQIRYYTLLDSMSQEFSRLSSAINAK